MDSESFLSTAVKTLGLSNLYKYFEPLKELGLTIVEVGTGNGYIARLLRDKGYNIIPIDKNPGKFISSVKDCKGLEPEYSTVDDLLKEKKDLVGNCVLFLNWPLPNDSSYDYDAMISLQPKFIITAVDMSGTGGGSKWLSYLENYVESGFYNGMENEWESEFKYNYTLVNQTIKEGYNNGKCSYRIIMLEKKDNSKDKTIKIDAPKFLPSTDEIPEDSTWDTLLKLSELANKIKKNQILSEDILNNFL